MRPESGLQIAPNWQIGRKSEKWQRHQNFPIWRHRQLFSTSLCLVTGPSFKSKLLLVLELWKSFLIRNWSEIWKSEIPPFEFCPISGDQTKSGIQNLERMSLIKCHWMLQNATFKLGILNNGNAHHKTNCSRLTT